MAERENNSNCCRVKTVCGRSLKHGVVLVGISSLVVSTISLLLSTVSLVQMTCGQVLFNSQPVHAVNMIFGLVSVCVSVYQMLLASLLLWQATKSKGNIFLCSVWYVSHLSILTLYFIILCARAVVCFKAKRYFSGVVTVIVGLAYEGTFIYFAIVVNSYLQSLSLEHERYF